MSPTRSLVEIREDSAVRTALILDDSGKRLELLTPDGRRVHVPASRVILDLEHELAAEGSDEAELLTARLNGLRAWERDAEERAKTLSLPDLHRLASERLGTGRRFDLRALAGEHFGAVSAADCSALTRSLTPKNPYFRFDGKGFVARASEEVARLEEQQREEEALERRRTEFVATCRARLDGDDQPWADGDESFLTVLRDVALHGERSKQRRPAGALAAAILDESAGSLSGERALVLLVDLGVYSRHENLSLLRAGIRLEFPTEVLEETERLDPTALDPGERVDLRDLEIVTIDDASTIEIDDGLSLQRRGNGWRLGIHVADAAHFVRPGTALDDEARQRSTTHYLPERIVPMLPARIGQDLASLEPEVDRPALSVMVDFTGSHELEGFRVHASWIRSRRRLTYEDCEAALEGRGSPDWIRDLAPLAKVLEQERLAAGATPIRTPELAIHLDEENDDFEVRLVDPGRPARHLVSEMMILANRLVAETCSSRGVAAIYRSQQPANTDQPPPPTDCYEPVSVNAFRRCLQRTEVLIEARPHAGLGVNAYLQATSPLRRYQDLVVHRNLKAALQGQPQPHDRSEVQALAVSTEEAGRRARGVENEVDVYWILQDAARRIGELEEAVVLRVESRRTVIELARWAHRSAVPTRPDHAPGQQLQVRIRAVHPRRGHLSVEQVGGGSEA
ncbi:MAG: ribonuclease R family protein [Acidobacteriota bacterium]